MRTCMDYMCAWDAVSYGLFKLVTNEDDADADDVVTLPDGNRYAEFEPGYTTRGCHIKVYKDGSLQGVLDLKHSNEELWADLGQIEDIAQKFNLGD